MHSAVITMAEFLSTAMHKDAGLILRGCICIYTNSIKGPTSAGKGQRSALCTRVYGPRVNEHVLKGYIHIKRGELR